MSAFITSVDVPKTRSIDYKSPTKNFEQIEEKYLNYTIEQNTKYADIEKIEQKFIELAIEKRDIYNKNKTKIARLNAEYNQLLKQIENELLKYYVMPDDMQMSNYNRQIKETSLSIKIKTHEQETYIRTYNRLYHTNILIKKRIENEIKYESINDKHYLEYKILKNHALLSLKKEGKKLDKMNNYRELSNVHFKFNMLKKAKIVNTLDFQIDIIKREMKNTELKLKNCNQLEKDLKKDISLQKRKYELYKKEYDWQIREYHKDNIEFKKILIFLNVKDINELISNFNTIKGEYQSLHSQFKFYNAEVSNLNNKLTQFENDLAEVKEKIRLKELEEKQKNKEALEDVKIIQKKKEINEATFYTAQSSLLCEKKSLILQTIMNFCVKNIRKIKNEVDLEFNNFEIFYEKRKIFDLITKGNKDLTINYIDVDEKIIFTFTFVFILFTNSFFQLLFISMNNIIAETVRYQPEFYMQKDFYSSSIFNRQFIQVYSEFVNNSFKQKEERNRILKKKERELLTNLKENESDSTKNKEKTISQKVLFKNFIEYIDKEGIILENESDLNSHSSSIKKKVSNKITERPQNNNKKLDKKKVDNGRLLNSTTLNNSVSQSNVNSAYSTWFTNKQLNKTFVSTHPHQMFKIMSKYQNELVLKDNDKKKKKVGKIVNYAKLKQYRNQPPLYKRGGSVLQTRQSSVKNENSATKSYSQRRDVYLNTNEEYDDENEESEGCKKKEETINVIKNQEKTEYQFYKNNPELAVIYNRINDLRLLDLKYFKMKSARYDNLGEIFFNFEKKYLKKSKIKSVYSMSYLNQKNKKEPRKNKSIEKESHTEELDNYSIYKRKSCTNILMKKDNNNEKESNNNYGPYFPDLGIKRSSRSFHIDSRKNRIIGNNLSNILKIDPNFFNN